MVELLPQRYMAVITLCYNIKQVTDLLENLN